MNKVHTYQRKDGGTTDCYGELTHQSNIQVTCEDESFDTILTDALKGVWNWEQLCKGLEEKYNDKIEELVAV